MNMSNITISELNLTINESVKSSPGEIIVEGIVIPIISLLGLIGNILSICVLRSSTVDMKVRPHAYITQVTLGSH